MKIKNLIKYIQEYTYINIVSINRKCAKNYNNNLLYDATLHKNLIKEYGNCKILRITTDSYTINNKIDNTIETITYLDIIIK